ncbi:MAG TPA: MarR family transcriptional regulator [Candidatus Acidoferrales bacterium]|nr:MarR family transcriptional regulator [Candidatus Acidoferrales bacterium]
MERLEPAKQDCAQEILEAVPMVMRTIRRQLRKHGAQVLSVPQFRTLGFLNRRKGASLSEVAEHIGLTLPSMSVLVDGLVERNYVTRKTHQDDRRRVTLMLTTRGETTLRAAREGTAEYISQRLSRLTQNERNEIRKAMRTLKEIFPEEGE